MSQIVSWEYYSSLYDLVNETDFDRKEKKAELEVKKVIGSIRWNTITVETYGYDDLKQCICMVINKMVSDEKSGKGKGITSASNDGYSESYAIQTEEQLQDEMRKMIKSCLSGTGLVGAY